MRFAPFAVCACVLIASACKGSDSGIPTIGPKDHDHVVVGNDDDAGPFHQGKADSGTPSTKADAGPRSTGSCERIDPLHSSGEDTPNLTSTDSPADFIVSRQALRWNTDCVNPILTLELSDGMCPNGAGHQLSLSFSANAIADGAIHLGENPVTPELDAPIQARYVRPKRLSPSGAWGNCGNANGQVIFLEAPDLSARTPILHARYQFDTRACDDATSGSQLVVGAFRVQLRVPLAEACPSRSM